jgi:hypothetical protein
MARITLGFGEFGWQALEEVAGRHDVGVGELVSAACRRFLATAHNEPLPRFASTPREDQRVVTVDLGPAELSALDDRAASLETTREALVRHAAIRLLADLDSGAVGAELAFGPSDEAD